MQILKLVLPVALVFVLGACSDKSDPSTKAAVASSLSIDTATPGDACARDGLLALDASGAMVQCHNGAWVVADDSSKKPCDQAGDAGARDNCKFHNTMTLTKREPYKRAPVTDPLLGRGLTEPAPSSSTAK